MLSIYEASNTVYKTLKSQQKQFKKAGGPRTTVDQWFKRELGGNQELKERLLNKEKVSAMKKFMSKNKAVVAKKGVVGRLGTTLARFGVKHLGLGKSKFLQGVLSKEKARREKAREYQNQIEAKVNTMGQKKSAGPEYTPAFTSSSAYRGILNNKK